MVIASDTQQFRPQPVIASEAKQSFESREASKDCRVAVAPRNDVSSNQSRSLIKPRVDDLNVILAEIAGDVLQLKIIRGVFILGSRIIKPGFVQLALRTQ